MSYVPDYIQPMNQCSSTVSATATTTASVTISRTSLRWTTASTNSTFHQPSDSFKYTGDGEQTTRRHSHAASYMPLREWRAPQEKVCGRVSIKDRLKSLESEADVRLCQVCNPVQKSRKWMARKGSMSNPTTPSHTAIISPKESGKASLVWVNSSNSSVAKNYDSSFNCSPQLRDSLDNGDTSRIYWKSDPVTVMRATPDIIQSHRPKVAAASEGYKEDEKALLDSSALAPLTQPPKDDSDHALRGDPTEDFAENFIEAVATVNPTKGSKICWTKTRKSMDSLQNLPSKAFASDEKDAKADLLPLSEKDTFPTEGDKHSLFGTTVNGQKAVSLSRLDSPLLKSPSAVHSSFPYREKLVKAARKEYNSSSGISKTQRENSLFGDRVSRSFSLLWKPPSQETISHHSSLHSPDKIHDAGNVTLIKKPILPPKPRNTVCSKGSISTANDVANIERGVDDGIGEASTDESDQQGRDSAAIVLGVKTPSATVTVELRSPRVEHGSQSFARHCSRDKRNARVFTMPSSDSDSENPFLILNQNAQCQPEGHGTVDLLLTPDEIRQMNLVRQRSVGMQLKHVSPVKFVPTVLKRDYVKNKSLSEEKILFQPSTEIYPELSGSSTVKARISSELQQSESEKGARSVGRKLKGSPPHGKKNQDAMDHRRKTTWSAKRSEGRSQSSDNRLGSKCRRNDTESRYRSNSFRDVNRDRPSPQQAAVAHAVQSGNTPEATIPFIDDAASPLDEATDLPSSGNAGHPVLPLAVTVRNMQSNNHTSPRRVSYMEAVGLISDLTPDLDDGSPYVFRRTRSSKGRMTRNGEKPTSPSVTLLRSNSADSVLSSTGGKASKSNIGRQARAQSADRNVAKRFHRRSYQIATCPLPPEEDNLSTPKRQPSIRKLKNFFGESTPQIVDATEEAVACKGRRNTDTSRILVLDDEQMSMSGYLYFKVATIEKGKRTSSQKSWKIVWAILKDRQLYLCKDCNRYRNSSDVSPAIMPYQLSLENGEPLSIRSSLVGIAYNYIKRRNVFKLTTFNGSEYLFQAENRDDMLSWISAMQDEGISHENGVETINEDLILRKTNQIEFGPKSEKRANRKRSPKPGRRSNLQVKDVDGSRRFKWRGSVNKIVKKFGTGQPFMPSGTFGVHLEDCPPSPANESVPFVVDLCCRIVDERGLHFTGIYRVPGNSAALASLQDDLNMHGVESIEPQDDRLKELNVVSSLLKSFFRKLPDPLFTNELYNDFIQANRRPTPEERLNCLRRLVHMLPGPHYETLKFLVAHLRLVADNSHENKMEVRNLAIVFGPTLVRSTASDNMATMVTDMSDQCRIVESIIEHAAWFFLDGDKHALEVVPASVPLDGGHEPLPSIGFLLGNVGRKPGDTSGNTSDSSKSKCSNESEKDSFSRDVIDLLFGKKWRQTGARGNSQNNVVDSADEHGGFEDQHRKKASWSPLGKHTGASPNKNTARASVKGLSDPPVGACERQSPKLVASAISNAPSGGSRRGPMDVSERLYQFYQEHLERLSKAMIGQPLPTLSSAESSPRITPRNSSDSSNLPVAYPALRQTAEPYPHPEFIDPVSKKQPYRDTRIAISGEQILSQVPGAQGQADTLTIQPSGEANYPRDVSNHGGSHQDGSLCNAAHISEAPIHAAESMQDKLRNLTNFDGTLESRSPQCHGPTTLEYEQELEEYHGVLMGESVTIKSYAQASKATHLKGNRNSSKSKLMQVLSSPKPVSTAFEYSSPKRLFPVSERQTADRSPSIRKSAQELHAEKRLLRQQQKRRKVRLKGDQHTFAFDENTFNRFDPKRRVIRSSSGELDPLHAFANRVHLPPQPTGKSLSAKEQLFGTQGSPQPVFQKKSFLTQECEKQRIVRRHTLSCVFDFTSEEYHLRDRVIENLDLHVQSGSNLSSERGDSSTHCYSASMSNLALPFACTGSVVITSAMDQLKPKAAASDLTLENWMIRERLKKDASKRDVSTSSSTHGLDKYWYKEPQKHTYKSYV